MYDEKVEIQKIYDRLKPFKSMVFKKDHTFQVDESISFTINIENDLVESKLQLDSIFSEILLDDAKQEISLIHRQLSTVIDNIRKKMEQQKKEEEEEKLKKEAEEKLKKEKEEREKKIESGIETEDDEEAKLEKEEEEKKKLINPNDQFKRDFNEKDLTIEKEEENKIELIGVLEDNAKQIKSIAGNIMELLNEESKIMDSISGKQEKQVKQVKSNSGIIDQLIGNKALNWIQLMLMMFMSIGLTMFTIVFIHVW